MARRRSKLDTEIQHLYGLPLGEFTAARNALAKQLKKSGDKEGSDEVASLPKPSVSAWAVNHLFTVAPEQMEELLASGDRARKALREILSGGDPGALRDAIQEARDLANELRDRAVDVLSEEGRRPGQAIVDRIATNLQSLAFSPAAEPQIERGWLDVDLPPPGFEVLAGLQLAATARPQKAPPKPAPTPKPVPAAKKKADDRREESKEEERLREKREREEARAREQREKEEARAEERRERLEAQRREKLARAQAERDEAAGRADFLRRKAEQAEKAAEELRERLEEAERAAEDARKRADEADKLLARADKAVRAAKG